MIEPTNGAGQMEEQSLDVERVSKTLLEHDPLHFRLALKTDSELSELRKRRRGRLIAQYQTMQNAVSSIPSQSGGRSS